MSLLASSFINRMGEPAVLMSRQLGARDPVTGYPEVTWHSGLCFDCDCFDPDCFMCDYNIYIIKEEVSLREVEVGGTRASQRVIKFFTYENIRKYDRIQYHGELYEVESVEPHFYLTGQRSFQHAVMVQMSYYGDIY